MRGAQSLDCQCCPILCARAQTHSNRVKRTNASQCQYTYIMLDILSMPAGLGSPCIVISERETQMAPEREAQLPKCWKAQVLQAASGSRETRERSRAEPCLSPIRGSSAAGTNQAVLDLQRGCGHDDHPGVNSWYCTCLSSDKTCTFPLRLR
jgi:hypothetical protein